MVKRLLPRTPAEWLNEIQLAAADASGADLSRQSDQSISAVNLFHLAPLVCLKFRGRKLRGREAKRVTEMALANYVVNSDPHGVDHGPEQRPLLAFAVCYVTAHLALDLVDDQDAEAILDHCKEHLHEGS
jgi:hypothetical protein